MELWSAWEDNTFLPRSGAARNWSGSSYCYSTMIKVENFPGMNSLHADHKGFQDILLKQQFFNITRNDGQRSVLINTFLGFFIIPCIRYFPYQQKNKFLTKRGLGYIYHCHAALRRKFIASILWNIAIRILCNFNTSLHFICLFCFVLFCFVSFFFTNKNNVLVVANATF